MPIVHFVNSKNQTAGGMKSVLSYVSQKKKTVLEDKKYVSGINCSPQSSYDEMMITKRLYHKTGGRLYYHLVQSFPSGYEIDPALAHKIAVEFAEKAFGKYECVVATHIDREHIHSHIVLNSVSFEDGKKYHSNLESVKGLMELSDEICLKYGVSTLDSPDDKFGHKKTYSMSDREVRAAEKGESWKIQLIGAITDCMREAKSKKQFCYLMRKRYGYGVRWEDNRKHITYTTPSGYRCRDKRLHEDKFLKEAMEREFKIRYAILNGEEQATASAGGTADHDDGYYRTELDGGSWSTDASGGVAGQGHQDYEQNNDRRADETVPRKPNGAVGGKQGTLSDDTVSDSGGHLGSDERIVVTGWEAERRILLSAERARRLAAEAQRSAYQGNNSLAVSASDIVFGIADVASIIDNAPTDPEELERYIEAHRAAQNAGLLIGAAVAAIEILSDRLEEMKARQENSEVESNDFGMN